MNIRRPQPMPRQGRRLGPPEVWGTPYLASHGTKATSIASYWRSRLPFATLQTLQMSPLAPLTSQAKAPRPHP